LIDLREQVVSFPAAAGPLPRTNLVVNIDSVIYYQVTDPRRAATYENRQLQSPRSSSSHRHEHCANVIGGITP